MAFVGSGSSTCVLASPGKLDLQAVRSEAAIPLLASTDRGLQALNQSVFPDLLQNGEVKDSYELRNSRADRRNCFVSDSLAAVTDASTAAARHSVLAAQR